MDRRAFLGFAAASCAQLPFVGSLSALERQDSKKKKRNARLKEKIFKAALENGAIAVGICSARKEFKHATRELNRKPATEVWPDCRSVINLAYP
ncbi:MAG: hypothetical protein ACYTAF_13800, partial [Planctomycetota bacterium]